MKITKRQKNAIVLNFIVYIVLLAITTLVIIYYIIPNVLEIEELKEQALEKYNKIKETKKTGIKFGIFKKNTNVGDLKNISQSSKGYSLEYLQGIIKDIDNKFFDESFKNKTNKDYKKFLLDLKDYYKNNEALDEKLKIVSKILPSYSEKIYEIDEENSLTDFRFINYIESLIYTFNLVYSNSIGIESVNLLPDYKVLSNDGSLDKNIYYITLDLTLEGRKQSILEFIYYIQNVGKVYLDEDGELQVFSEKNNNKGYFSDFILKKISYNKDLSSENYNIFNNQLAEITEISFVDDIDSDFDFTNSIQIKDTGFIKYLENTNQMNEKFGVKLSIKFYVKGLPKYKVEKFVKDFKIEYDIILEEIKKLLKNNKINYIDRKKLEGINTTINSLSPIINPLIKNKEKKEITDIYNEIYKHNIFLKDIKKKIHKIQEKYKEDDFNVKNDSNNIAETSTGKLQVDKNFIDEEKKEEVMKTNSGNTDIVNNEIQN